MKKYLYQLTPHWKASGYVTNLYIKIMDLKYFKNSEQGDNPVSTSLVELNATNIGCIDGDNRPELESYKKLLS